MDISPFVFSYAFYDSTYSLSGNSQSGKGLRMFWRCSYNNQLANFLQEYRTTGLFNSCTHLASENYKSVHWKILLVCRALYNLM